MDKLTPNDGASTDIVAENIEKLREIFPEVFADGSVDFDALKQTLGSYVDEREERYSFTWHGKSRARRIAQMPSTGTLLPCKEESVNWESTQNIFIEGDNLEVLKILQKSYHRKVKMIYIDPPYNTGNEFIYPDKYQDNLDTYLKYTGQVDYEDFKLSANTETSGRYHTNWLNMMYPRLKLARNLLRDDGVIFVSIDDHEVHNLRQLMDEVLGPENFLGTFVWNGGRKNDAKRISLGHDYILAFGRDEAFLRESNVRWKERKAGIEHVYSKADELRKEYGNDYQGATKALQAWYKSLPDASASKAHSHYKMVDGPGVWYGDNISSPNYRANLIFDWKGYAPPKNGWRYNLAAMTRLDAEGLLVYPVSKDRRIQYKRYLHHTEEWSPASVFYQDRRTASKHLNQLMGEDLFDFPKDVNVIGRLITTVTETEDIILDCFAGSGTTGHAVMTANVSEESNRRFILVQLPERLKVENKSQQKGAEFCAEIGKPANLAELTKERLRRSGGTIKAANPACRSDLGFKVFKLSSSNIKPWDTDFEELDGALLGAIDNIKSERSEQDVLYELLLKYGLDLAIPVDERTIADKTVFIIGAGALVVCLDSGVSLDVVRGIAQLKTELKPEVMRVVFKDSGFENDVVKTNTVQILKQAGVDDVKSL